MKKYSRRDLLIGSGLTAAAAVILPSSIPLLAKNNYKKSLEISSPENGENIFKFIKRTTGKFDETLYRQIIGSTNEFKEGDEAVGVAAVDEQSRVNARK